MRSRLTLFSLLIATTWFAAPPEAGAWQCLSTESFELFASDGVDHQGHGTSLSVSENWIAVGAEDVLSTSDGAVYVYSRSGAFQEIRIDPPEPGLAVGFGTNVAIDGSWLAVAEPYWSTETGRVHLYEFAGGLWNYSQSLENDVIGIRFGWEMTLDAGAGLLVVGDDAQLHAEIYGLENGIWSGIRGLQSLIPGAAFGTSLELSGNLLAVGAPGEFGNTGAVYIYQGSGLLWAQLARISPAEIGPGDKFGYDLGFDGDQLLVGCPEFDQGVSNCGAVFAFSLVGENWVERPVLTMANPVEWAGLGYRVEMEGEIAVAYGPNLEVPGGNRSLVQYRLQGNQWVEQQMLTVADAADGSILPHIAIKGDLVVVGDPYGNGLVPGSGHLFGFEIASELSLAVTPAAPNLGENIFFDTCGGAPANPAGLFAIGADGLPVFVKLFPGSFDGDGSWGFFVPYNSPGLVGHSLDLISFGMNANGKVRASNVAELAFQ